MERAKKKALGHKGLLISVTLASTLGLVGSVYAQEQNQPANPTHTSSFWGHRWGARPQNNENSVQILDICHNTNHDPFPKGVVQPSGHKCLNVFKDSEGIEVSVWEVDGKRRYNVYFDPRITQAPRVTAVAAVSTQAPTAAMPTEQPSSTVTAVNLEPVGQQTIQVNSEFASGSTIQEVPYAEIIGPWELYNSNIFDPKQKHESIKIENATGFQIVGKVSVPTTAVPILGRVMREDYYQVNIKYPWGENVPGYMPARYFRIEKRPQADEVDFTKTQKEIPTVVPEVATATITPEPLEPTIIVEEIPTIESTQTPPPQIEQSLVEAVAPRSQAGLNQNLTVIAAGLEKFCILNANVLDYALATIGHETAGTYQPIEEYGGRAQAIRLGYQGGENYFGRGFIQLTHLSNYEKFGNLIGHPELAANPEKALEPEISAEILAAFFKVNGVSDLATQGNFVGARRPINPDNLGGQIAAEAYRLLPLVQKDFDRIQATVVQNPNCNS